MQFLLPYSVSPMAPAAQYSSTGLLADIHYWLILPRETSLNCYQNLLQILKFQSPVSGRAPTAGPRFLSVYATVLLSPFQLTYLNTHHMFPSPHLLEPLPPLIVYLLTSDLCLGAQISLRNASNAAFMRLSIQERNIVFLVHIFFHFG